MTSRRTFVHATPLVALVVIASAFACGNDEAPSTRDDAGTNPSANLPPSGPPSWANVQGDRRAPLPKQVPAITDTFNTSDSCAACHTVGEGSKVLRDAKDRDVSPVASWRPSMMAMSARDPFYLAVVDEERSSRPGAEATIDGACIRCHAPAAVVERSFGGAQISLPDLFTGTDKELHAGREGVTCSVCHQITRPTRGADATFGGLFSIGENREIYGPHQQPETGPMRMFVSYTPTYSTHMIESELCASCHTVFTRAYDAGGKAIGPKLPEQVTFLEWRNSLYSASGNKGASCQACHLPTGDDDEAPIETVLAKLPATGLSPRKPLGRHLFLGGNVTMLRAFADDGGWSGASADSRAFTEQAERTKKNLARAAKLSVVAKRTSRGLEIDASIDNLTGHKFPTGYPSRRAWLHVRVSSGSNVVFESGKSDAYGRIVDREGHVLVGEGGFFAHRDTLTRETDVQVYEAVLGNELGKVVSRPLDATRYLKDNRLLPLGYSPAHPDAALTVSYGPEKDPNFGSSDVVHYVVEAVPAGALTIDCELLFQSVRPSELDTLAEHPTPTARKLFDLVSTKLEPTPVARTSTRVE